LFQIGADLIDPDDPTYIAENELFNAAQSIESAAKKLSVLKPRRKPKVYKIHSFSFACLNQRPVVMICLIFGCLMHDSTEYCSYQHNYLIHIYNFILEILVII